MERPDFERWLEELEGWERVEGLDPKLIIPDWIASIKYAFEQEQKALLMEKAFKIILYLGKECPPDVECNNKNITCAECRRQYALSEAERQMKEEPK